MWLSPRMIRKHPFLCLPANTTVTTLGSSVSSTALGRGERYIPVYPVPAGLGSPYLQQGGSATPSSSSNRQMSNVSTPSPAVTRHYRTPPPPPSDQVFRKHDFRFRVRVADLRHMRQAVFQVFQFIQIQQCPPMNPSFVGFFCWPTLENDHGKVGS